MGDTGRQQSCDSPENPGVEQQGGAESGAVATDAGEGLEFINNAWQELDDTERAAVAGFVRAQLSVAPERGTTKVRKESES